MTQPIGIFDSGVGGLTVLKRLLTVLPEEKYVYLGDTARVPYGTKSAQTVTRYAEEGIRFLLQEKVQLVVVACNTASANSLPFLQDQFSVPIIGVVEPGVRQALSLSRSKRIGVIGTEGTIGSQAYQSSLKSSCKEVQILARSCPLFVPLAETGWVDNEVTLAAASRYLEEFKRWEADVLILGCTHYPLLKSTIARVMEDKVILVDSAEETAAEVARILGREESEEDELPSLRKVKFFVTDSPERFGRVGEGFLNVPLTKVIQASL